MTKLQNELLFSERPQARKEQSIFGSGMENDVPDLKFIE